MFHGWMFDPDGDQAAADSTRSSTTLDTGSSVNPRTARRLVTASYTSIFTVIVLIQIFSSNSSEPEMFCGSDLFSSYEQRSAFVLHQKHDEFRRVGLACVPSNDVNIIWPFIAGLSTSPESLLFPLSPAS